MLVHRLQRLPNNVPRLAMNLYVKDEIHVYNGIHLRARLHANIRSKAMHSKPWKSPPGQTCGYQILRKNKI